jgi:hypothetical protein
VGILDGCGKDRGMKDKRKEEIKSLIIKYRKAKQERKKDAEKGCRLSEHSCPTLDPDWCVEALTDLLMELDKINHYYEQEKTRAYAEQEIGFQCIKCQSTIRTRMHIGGKVLNCPKCGKTHEIWCSFSEYKEMSEQ